MLQQFSEIHEEGLFFGYKWPSDLEDFSKLNLIYGWNGTGKTTLSRLLNQLCDQTTAKSIKMSIKVDDGNMDSSKFEGFPYVIKVFNRDYISETISVMSDDAVDPIYFIGREAVQIQNEIKQNSDKLSALQNELDKRSMNKNLAEKELEEFCSLKAKEIKNKLASSGAGIRKYQNYFKTNYKRDVVKVLNDRSLSRDFEYTNISDLDRLLGQIREPAKKEIDLFEYAFPNFESIGRDVNDILKTEVIRDTIKELLENFELEEWTSQGLKIFKANSSNLCPWCMQKPPADRVKNLEKHFNDAFNKLVERISSSEQELKSIINNIPKLKSQYNADLYPELINDYRKAEADLNEALVETTDWCNSMISELYKKRNNMDTSVEIAANIPKINNSFLIQINAVINKHNMKCRNFINEIGEIGEQFVLGTVCLSIERYNELRNTLEKCEAEVKSFESQISELEKKITELNAEARDSVEAIRELNKEISDYFGHSEIQFKARGSGYTLLRMGNQVRQLSDGEISTIALLYFLKSTADERITSTKTIIVIDDPVSSLDSNNLYRATMSILKRIKGFHQILLFTHNFVLFRETLKVARQENMETNVYVLDAIKGFDGKRKGIISLAPKILEKSEYEFLFGSMLKVSRDEVSRTEWHYNLPNMARRLLEAFLTFQFSSEKNLTDTIKEIDFDYEKKNSILRFLHTYSHKDTIPDPNQEENAISEARYIVKYLMEMIRHLNEDHYNGMVETIDKLDK